MTKTTVKLIPDVQTKVLCRFHPEIPTIRFDGSLTYSFYITIQNLIHLNVIYIFLYHSTFWLDPTKSKNGIVYFVKKLKNTTEYEQNIFLVLENNHDSIVKPTISVHLINKYIYVTLIGVSTIELIASFLWTLQKKLSFSIQRNLKWRNRLKSCIIGIILIIYLIFISWLFFHTFITQYLTLIIFIIVLIHFIFLIFLDKPNLFSTTFNRTHKQYRHFPPSISVQSRKFHSLSSRWSSETEQKLDTHECSIFYADIRTEADNQWTMIVRRMALKFYRTLASFIFFDVIPYKMINTNISSIDNQRYRILIMIFALSTLLTHSIFLFPAKFQVNLHRLSIHLGQWRFKSLPDETDLIDKWSSECNSYTNGHIIKLSTNNTEKYFIAIQHLSNAAHPLSISHSIFYRLFGNITFFFTIQFRLCSILICSQFYWIISGQFGFEILISILIILNNSYTIFKIVRDRLIFDMINEHQSDAFLLTSKQENK